MNSRISKLDSPLLHASHKALTRPSNWLLNDWMNDDQWGGYGGMHAPPLFIQQQLHWINYTHHHQWARWRRHRTLSSDPSNWYPNFYNLNSQLRMCRTWRRRSCHSFRRPNYRRSARLHGWRWVTRLGRGTQGWTSWFIALKWKYTGFYECINQY